MKFKFFVVFLFFANICSNSSGAPYRNSAKGKEIVEAEDTCSEYEEEEKGGEEEIEEEEKESQVSSTETNTSDEEKYSRTQSSLKKYPKVTSKRKDDNELCNRDGVQIIGKIKVVNMVTNSENSSEQEEDVSWKLKTQKSLKKYLKGISKGKGKKEKVNSKGVQIIFKPTIVNLITHPGCSKSVQQDTGFYSPERASSSNTKKNNKKREKHSSTDPKRKPNQKDHSKIKAKGNVNTNGIQISATINISNRVTHRKGSKKQGTNSNTPEGNLSLKLKPIAGAAVNNTVAELEDVTDEEETQFTPKSKIIKNTGLNYNNEGIQISGKVKSINQVTSPCSDEQPADVADEEEMQLTPDSEIFLNTGYNYNRKGTQVTDDAKINLKNLIQDMDSDTAEGELTIELIQDIFINEDTNSIMDTEIKIEIFPFQNATDEDTHSEGEIRIEINPYRSATRYRTVEQEVQQETFMKREYNFDDEIAKSSSFRNIEQQCECYPIKRKGRCNWCKILK